MVDTVEIRGKYRIYFFANLGNMKQTPYGGGEVGNRRTLKLLRQIGYDVVVIPKYDRVHNHSFFNILRMMWRVAVNIITFFVILFVGRREKSIVHIVGFYGSMIYFESLLTLISKLLGYRTVYEMRGGGAETYYRRGSHIYHLVFNKTIKMASSLFSQGLENYNLIYSIDSKKKIFYYPNYVETGFYPETYPQKPIHQINIMYFGRISATKNVDLVIDSFIEINKMYPNSYLDVLGNYSDKYYMTMLKEKIDESGAKNKVRFWSACDHDTLKKHLVDKHFYFFPSTEPHEGHSNALTEAMSWGLIPITTSQGFNRSIVGDDSLIVEQLSAKEFTKYFSRIIDNDILSELSKKMYSRITENYTDKNIFITLEKEYDDLFHIKQ